MSGATLVSLLIVGFLPFFSGKFPEETRMDCVPVGKVTLNFEFRDDIVPVLADLQYLYWQIDLPTEMFKLAGADVSENTRNDVGCECFSYTTQLKAS